MSAFILSTFLLQSSLSDERRQKKYTHVATKIANPSDVSKKANPTALNETQKQVNLVLWIELFFLSVRYEIESLASFLVIINLPKIVSPLFCEFNPRL